MLRKLLHLPFNVIVTTFKAIASVFWVMWDSKAVLGIILAILVVIAGLTTLPVIAHGSFPFLEVYAGIFTIAFLAFVVFTLMAIDRIAETMGVGMQVTAQLRQTISALRLKLDELIVVFKENTRTTKRSNELETKRQEDSQRPDSSKQPSKQG